MPRKARQLSGSNIYHVMLRGVNRQVIFEDNEDRRYFLAVLKYCKEISGFRLHAFCLMPNHVHLLIEPAGEPLDLVFRRVGTRYAVWYNRKHSRVGHLFQDRFRSENVETDRYYMTVLRYILQNPMKAGMESRPGTFRWSSYMAYVKGSGSITDTEYAVNLFGSREVLVDFVRQDNEDSGMDEEDPDDHLTDHEAREIMERMTNCTTPAAFLRLEKPVRKEYVRNLFMENLSAGQIVMLTGMSRATVYRAVKDLLSQPPENENPMILNEADEYGFISDASEIW